MIDLVDSLNAWSSAWTALALTVAWQWTLVVGAIAVVAALLRGASPAVRYWLWQIATIKLLLMPLWTTSLALPAGLVGAWSLSANAGLPAQAAPAAVAMDDQQMTGGPARPGDAGVAAGPNLAATKPPATPLRAEFAARLSWSSWLLLAWAAIVALQIARLIGQQRRLAALLRDCRPAAPETMRLAGDAAGTLGLRNCPAIAVTRERCSPFAGGLVRPVIVLPESLLTELSRDELRQVLLHELAHVKRRDLAWGWTAQAARVFYFFHPAVHWVAWRLRLERELACDHVAMAGAGRSPAQYAETLVHIVSRISQPATSPAALALTGGERSGAALSLQSSANQTTPLWRQMP
ncbi:MAG: M56 family metallopeptidase [Pirellulales bacterium]